MNYFIQKEQSLNVVLDRNAIIVDFESNIDELIIDKRDVIGKNWFDEFIETSDRDKVMEVFSDLLRGEAKKWQTYKNDIKTKNGKHLFLDFENEIIVENEEKKLKCKGSLHYQPF